MKRPSLKKRGKPFEVVVRDVFRLFDQSATVEHGRWVVGTYGRRELDVTIEGTVGGIARKVIIECKDYNPKKTGPVGVETVDALITKRRLVGADLALICSNAGFTSQALREAKGEGIGLISVMRAGDSRIRFQVQEEIYTRRIKVDSINLRVHFPEQLSVDLSGVPSDAITFRGAPLIGWACQRASLLIGSNPIVSKSYFSQNPGAHLKKVLENGTKLALDVKAGDKILFGKYSGTEIKIDGQEYLILREDEVLAVIG